jgi:hypothetical protein
MNNYVYNLRLKDIAVTSEKHIYVTGDVGVDYRIEIDSLEQLITVYKTVCNDCILTYAMDGTGTVVPTIEVYDSWRE